MASSPRSPDCHVSATPPSSPTVHFDHLDDIVDCTLPPPSWTPTLEHNNPQTTTPQSHVSHSANAQALLGASIPYNTTKANNSALKALATFVIKTFRPYREFLLRRDDKAQALLETRCSSFTENDGSYLPHGYNDWTTEQLKHVRFYLIEFVANYKNTRTGKDIHPSTLKTYILALQRSLKAEWGYDLKLLSGAIFNSPEEGLFSVLDNKVREQQRVGNHVVSYNVLSREDLRILYSSPSLFKETPNSFQTRLVFTIGILTAMRPSALAKLSVSQFRKNKAQGGNCLGYQWCCWKHNGTSKTGRGGWAAIGNKVSEIPIWDEDYEDGRIKFYKDIDEYMSIRSNLEVGTDRFFLAINASAVRRKEFFKRQHMGKNSFMTVVKTACVAEGIEGKGQKNFVTTHGLRGTLATLLFQNGHSDSSVALRTGHRDPKSLKSYQNLHSVEGKQKQRDLFRTQGERKRFKHCEDDKENNTALQRVTSGSRTPFASVENVTGGTVNVTVNCYLYPDDQ